MENSLGNISPELLAEAQKKTGMSPEETKKAAESGDLSAVFKNIGAEQSKKIKEALSSKQSAMKLLSTPKAQALLKKFLGGK